MQSPFDRFEIDHLSPYALRLWRSVPGLWARQYIAGEKSETTARQARGKAVETGLAAILHGQSLETAVALAMQNFDLNAVELDKEEVADERKLIKPMVATCFYWDPPGKLSATQLRVEIFVDPIPIPIVGYLDFAFDTGIDVDLKTIKACPSKPRPDDVRQVSIYRAARHREGAILYVTDKRRACYEVTDEMAFEALEQIQADATQLYNFLARMETREQVMQCLPYDPEHWLAGGRKPKTKVPLIDALLA